MKFLLNLILFVLLTYSAVAQYNGISFYGTALGLGNMPLSVNPTIIDLNQNNVWWRDPGTPNLGLNFFRIGDGNFLKDPYTNYNDAKFSFRNNSEYHTGFISSNSNIGITTLWVEHTNWPWSVSSGFSPTNPTAGGYNHYWNFYSHLAQGAADTNVVVFSRLDTSLARINYGVRSEIDMLDALGTTISNLNFFNVKSTKNFAGDFLTDVTYNDSMNVAVFAKATTEINATTSDWPLYNIGVWSKSLNAREVFGGKFFALNGLDSNIAIYAKPGNTYATGTSSNIGVMSEINKNPNNSTGTKNYSIWGKNVNNSGPNQNIGTYNELFNNSYCNLNIGLMSNIHNDTSTYNYGILDSLYQNEKSDYNIGEKIIIEKNNNNSNFPNQNQINKGIKASINNSCYAKLTIVC